MADNLSILVQALLDEKKSTENINKALKNLKVDQLPVDIDTKGAEKQIKELQKSLSKSSVDSNFSEPYKKAYSELQRLYNLKERYAKLTVPSQETSSLFEQQIKAQEAAYKQQSVGITQKFGDSISNAAAQFFTFQQAISITKRFVGDAVNFLIDLDNALNEIRIVTGKSASEAENLGMKYNQMAKDMNVSTREIAQASVEFYRQGLDDNKVEENLIEAIKYGKIAKVELKQAAEIITASVNSMGVPMAPRRSNVA